MKSFSEVKVEVDGMHTNISEVVNSIVDEYTKKANDLVSSLKDSLNNLSNEQIRWFMLMLSCEAFSLSEIKENSNIKSECAETFLKLAQADASLNTSGTVEAKKNSALLNTENEQLVNIAYDSISSLLKVKLDEIHRVVDALKSVLISRNSEAKLTTEVDMM